ncbi:hypothetical protein JTB14_037819 [Gonioctena quinquepunctata]|nr:hypothetical protein JTB14_037819 [Gonioctena quinquepunctata]
MLLEDHEGFFGYTRMTPKLFEILLTKVGPKLQKDPSKNPLPPVHRLLITLHYLSEGCSMKEIACGHYLGHSTVSVIIKETTKALWEVLAPSVLKVPSVEEWKAIANGFYERWNLPNCIGAVDGKHVNIQAPKHSGSTFFNYKKNFSIVLMASCDAFYRFTLVDIGAAGGNHDSVVSSLSGLDL